MTAVTTDRDLLERIAERDEEALREAIAIHGGLIFALASRIVRDHGIAEEVTQDVFLALWNSVGRVDSSKGTLKSFLIGVARNKSIDRIRRSEVQKRLHSAAASVLETAPDAVAGAEEHVLDRRRLIDAFRRLSEVQREALVLAYFGGRSYKEVAEELGIPEGTIKTRMRDGLRALRRHLTNHSEETEPALSAP
jgi:RNA polymerase sigma-70 factor, ECF subfamily